MFVAVLFFGSFSHLTFLLLNGVVWGVNILAIVLGQFKLITQKHDNQKIFVRFVKGIDYIVYDTNQIFTNIGT